VTPGSLSGCGADRSKQRGTPSSVRTESNGEFAEWTSSPGRRTLGSGTPFRGLSRYSGEGGLCAPVSGAAGDGEGGDAPDGGGGAGETGGFEPAGGAVEGGAGGEVAVAGGVAEVPGGVAEARGGVAEAPGGAAEAPGGVAGALEGAVAGAAWVAGGFPGVDVGAAGDPGTEAAGEAAGVDAAAAESAGASGAASRIPTCRCAWTIWSKLGFVSATSVPFCWIAGRRTAFGCSGPWFMTSTRNAVYHSRACSAVACGSTTRA